MPTTPEEATNASFQRAVNPFSVRGSESGVLAFGNKNWINYHAEARFYFGVPETGRVVNTSLQLADVDMLIAQGATAVVVDPRVIRAHCEGPREPQ